MKIIKALYMLGAAALLFGAVARMFLPEYYALIYIIGAVVFAVAEFGIRSILLKNKQLYRQMEHTALNELKVKNLKLIIQIMKILKKY